MNKVKVIFKRVFSWFLHRRDKIRHGRRYLMVKRICMRMSWNTRRMSKLEMLSLIFYFIVSILVTVYIAQNLKDLTPPIFELAKVCAIVGGLVLAGGFVANSPRDLKFKMRRVGTLYLLATLSFVVLGLALPVHLLEVGGISQAIFTVVTFASMVSGIVSFALATSWLTMLLPKLWSED